MLPGPGADSHQLYSQWPQPEEEADRGINKQTVEAGEDQRKLQLGTTPQAELMKRRESANQGRLQREGTGGRSGEERDCP